MSKREQVARMLKAVHDSVGQHVMDAALEKVGAHAIAQVADDKLDPLVETLRKLARENGFELLTDTAELKPMKAGNTVASLNDLAADVWNKRNPNAAA